MLIEKPYNQTISQIKRFVIFVATSILLLDIKGVIIENLSTTTNIESLPFFYLGKPNTKFMEISTNGLLGTGKEVYKSCSWNLDFSFPYVMHISHMHCIFFFILDQ